MAAPRPISFVKHLARTAKLQSKKVVPVDQRSRAVNQIADYTIYPRMDVGRVAGTVIELDISLLITARLSLPYIIRLASTRLRHAISEFAD